MSPPDKGAGFDWIEALDVVLWLADAELRRLVRLSASAPAPLGYERDRWLSEEGFWLRIVHPEDSESVLDTCRLAARDGEPRSCEHRLVTADGRVVWCHTRVRRLPDGSLAGLTADVSLERQRRAARDPTVLQTALDCVISMDHRGRILEFNPAAERTFGYRRADVLGQPMADLLIPPSQREAHRQGLARYLATREGPLLGRRIEVVAIRADGSEFPAELAVTRVGSSEPPVFTGYLRDITERKWAERRAAERLAHQRVLLELSRMDFSDLDAVLRRITEKDARTLNVERVSVWRFTADRAAIVCEDLYRLGANEHERGVRLEAHQYPRYFQALEDSRTIAADDARQDPRTREFAESYLEPLGITSMMDVPIRLEGMVVGVVCHEHVGPFRRWELHEQEFAGAVADLVSLAFASAERRRVESALRSAEDRLRTLLDKAPVILFATDRDGVLTLCEGCGLAALGARPGENVGRSIFELYGHAPWVCENIRRALRGETFSSGGEISGTWWEIQYTPLLSEAGEVTGVTGIAIDVTERKAAEAARREAEARLRAVVEHAPIVLFALDREGTVVLCEGSGLQSLGLDPSRLLGRSAYALYRNDPDILADLRRAVAGEAFTSTGRARGRIYEVHYVPLPGADGEIAGTVGIATDVTERERVRQELERSLSLLRATLESTADGILVVDRAGKIVTFNQKFLEMWSLPESSLRPGDDQRQLASLLGQLARPEEITRRVQELYADPDARGFDTLELLDGRIFERYSQPQRVGGECVGRVWSFRDVTERRRAEREVARLLQEEQRARAAAEKAVRLRDEFLSIASHELRTPLTSLQYAVQGLRRLAQSDPSSDPPVRRRALEIAERQCRRLGKLVGDLLDVSRLSEGRLRLELEEFDLCELAREVASRFEDELARARCTFSVRTSGAVVGRWDRSRIDQVVTNLLSNAIKFGAGGPVELSVEPAAELTARLVVRDRGIGIPLEIQDRIFDRYERGVSPRHYGGLGLGLHIVRSIVEAHAGRVSVESAPGQGAAFTVHLPLAGPEQPRP